MRPPVWIGDLLTAWAAIGRRPEQLDALVELLELDLDAGEPGASIEDSQAAPSLVAVAVAAVPALDGMPPAATRGAELAAVTRSWTPRAHTLVTLVIERLPDSTSKLRPWDAATPLVPAERVLPPSRLLPLFPHSTSRAVLGAATHSVRSAGTVDVARTVRLISERRTLRELPRGDTRTHRAGIQLVVDRTWAMTPFSDDVATLRRQLFTLVGQDRIDELWFAGDLDACHRPLRARRNRRAVPAAAGGSTPPPTGPRTLAWQAPPAGVPVVVISDLGRAAARRGDDDAQALWDRFFARASNAGCDVVAIVPRRLGARERGKRATAIAWDTRTTAGAVQSARASVRD